MIMQRVSVNRPYFLWVTTEGVWVYVVDSALAGDAHQRGTDS